MITRQLKVRGDVLLSRKAGDFVEVASDFSSSIYLESGNKRVNAKSVIGVMSMSIGDGDEITVLVNGEDEEQAIISVEEYLVRA